ncbi:MAG: GYF domain-containing protein, partial [Myxococcota bacterium]
AGKVFKIRCKKCGAIIVVRGDHLTPAGADQREESAAVEYSGEAIWYVVVDGEQQGPYVPAQLSTLLAEGTIDWESYVWREGFDGWKACRDVVELVSEINGGATTVAAAPHENFTQDSTDSTPIAEPHFTNNASFTDAAESSGSGASATFSATTGSAAVSRNDAGADLFAQPDAASPFGSNLEPAEPQAPAVSNQASSEESMTGQRNENSVLFSLQNLQALATGSEHEPQGPADARPAAPDIQSSREGSGLIDIRALANAAQSTDAPFPNSNHNVDDLLSIGAGPSPLSGGGLGAPVLGPIAPERERSSKVPVAIVSAAAMILVASVLLVFALRGESEETTVAAIDTPAAAATGSITAPTNPEQRPSMETPAKAIDPERDTGDVDESDRETEAPKRATETQQKNTSRRRDREAERRRQLTQKRNTTAASETTAPSQTATNKNTAVTMTTAGTMSQASSRPSSMNGNRTDLETLLDRAVSGNGASSMQPAMVEQNLPEAPDRPAVLSALTRVAPQVAACGNGQHGTAFAAVTVSGASGRVTNVQVTGEFAGTAVGSCVARAVRGARFPRFSRSTFSVNFPYRI